LNEIITLCKGYSHLNKNDALYNILESFYKIEESKPLKCASPWKMLHKNQSHTAILALHGYKGYPGEMIYPGLKLYQAGYDVYCPRYVGHGVTKEDFIKTNSENWLDIARITLGYLKKEYNEVYVIGHSMGGLIATIVSAEFDIKKTALISPAFFISGFSSSKVYINSLIRKEIDLPWQMDKSFWGICERDEEDDLTLGKRYWSKVILKQILELDKIRKKAIIDLEKYEGSMFSIFGDKDLSVDINKAITLLEKNNENNILVIKGSNHLCQYFNDESLREKCNNAIVDFIKD